MFFKSHSYLFTVLIFLFSLLLQGCGNPLNLFKRTRISTEGQSNTLMKSASIPLEQPNHYQVNLRWAPFLFEDEDSKQGTWMVLKAKGEHSLAPWLSLHRGQSEATDTEVEAGAPYHYAVGFWSNSQFIEKGKTQITIPKDLVVSDVIRANNLTQFSRIFIAKTGVIDTQGARLQLTADELVSEGGTIRSLDPSQIPILGSNGLSPESLVIQVKKASGQLKIQALGQNGGKGQIGATGAPGIEGDYQTPCRNPMGNYAETGLPGYPGGQGGKGGDGGNSPKVYVEVLSANSFEVTIDRVAGKGGEGGNGGSGGIGGKWNNPNKNGAKRPPKVQCWIPEAYVHGPSGPQGPQGPAGATGNTLPYCKKIQGKEEGDCFQFYEKSGFVF